MNNNLVKDIELLRLNDLNNKIKHLDRKIDKLIDNVKYTNIKIIEIHDELFNNYVTSPNIKRSISPIMSPDKNKYKIKDEHTIYEISKSNMNKGYNVECSSGYYSNNGSSEENSPRYPNSQILPTKADKTYLGVHTYKSINASNASNASNALNALNASNVYLPNINKSNKNSKNGKNSKNNKNIKKPMISRGSFDSLNSFGSLK